MQRKRKLSTWSKRAKIAMIEKDIGFSDICEGTGYTLPHVSSIINGRLISDKAISKISDYLGISDDH